MQFSKPAISLLGCQLASVPLCPCIHSLYCLHRLYLDLPVFTLMLLCVITRPLLICFRRPLLKQLPVVHARLSLTRSLWNWTAIWASVSTSNRRLLTFGNKTSVTFRSYQKWRKSTWVWAPAVSRSNVCSALRDCFWTLSVVHWHHTKSIWSASTMTITSLCSIHGQWPLSKVPNSDYIWLIY